MTLIPSLRSIFVFFVFVLTRSASCLLRTKFTCCFVRLSICFAIRSPRCHLECCSSYELSLRSSCSIARVNANSNVTFSISPVKIIFAISKPKQICSLSGFLTVSSVCTATSESTTQSEREFS